MKKVLMTSMAVFTVLVIARAGHAEEAMHVDPEWYVRADAGVAFQDRTNASPKVNGQTGWTADIAAGRSLAPNFRAEAELLFAQGDQKHVDRGRIKVLAGLANGYYDLDTGTKLKPFVGAGLGIGQVKLGGGTLRDDDTGLAYQLLTGVAYPITDKLSAQIGYRYLGVNDVAIGSGAQALHGDYHDQAVTVGLTYKFGF